MATDGHERDDAALVLAAQAGDREAFGELFRRHHPRVRRVCARRMGSPVEADEVAQAAFVRAYERIGQCRGDRRFGAWVQVIALRLCADAWRARARTTPLEQPLDDAAVGPDDCEEALLRREQVATVRRAIAVLPSRQRKALVARDLEGRRPGEIAAALAVSLGAVDSLLVRARRRVALAYQALGADQGAVSTSVATATATAAAVNARPLARLLQSASRALDVAALHAASALGLGPAPSAAHRVAGLAAAAALSVAPLVPAALPGPGQDAAPLVPVVLPAAPVPPAALTLPAAALPAPPSSPPAPALGDAPLAAGLPEVAPTPALGEAPSAPAPLPHAGEGTPAEAPAVATVAVSVALDHLTVGVASRLADTAALLLEVTGDPPGDERAPPLP